MAGYDNDASYWHWRISTYKPVPSRASVSRSTTPHRGYLLFCMAKTIWYNTTLLSDLLAPDFSLLLVLRHAHTDTLAPLSGLIGSTTASWQCCQHYIA